MMDGLRFLNFYGRHYSQEDKMHLPPTGLEYLPNELRYLQWIGFPSKSLQPSFRAAHLVELHLWESKLVKLWTGVKDVGNLRTIDLCFSIFDGIARSINGKKFRVLKTCVLFKFNRGSVISSIS
ncbi:disease resistance protein RPS6-like [Populus alba x Populus x berolinensis]|nr:disease resistance protein RPS6-like [Populus alba x Populus x berolinensis]